MTTETHHQLMRAQTWFASLLGPVAPPLRRHIAYGILYVLSVFVGRMTAVAPTHISLVWPAAGVGLVWVLTGMMQQRQVRDITIALSVMSAASLVINTFTGSIPIMTAAFCLGNALQALVGAWFYRGGKATRWTISPVLTTRRQLFRLCLASVVGSLVGSMFAPVVSIVLGTGGWDLVWQSTLRTGLSVFAVGALMLRMAFPTRPYVRTPHPFHMASLLVVATVAYLTALLWFPHLPLVFTITAVTVWAATTLTFDGVVVFTLLTGLVTMVFTLSQHGPFVLAGPILGVFLAQAYVLMTTFTGFILGLVREERARLIEEVLRAREVAVRQAALVEHIISSMDDPVIVVDDSGVIMRNSAACRVFAGAETCTDGSALREIYTGEDGSSRVLDLALHGATTPEEDIVLERSDNEEPAVMSVRARPIGPDGGMAVAILHDVTDSRRHVAELSSFAGVLAHDLLNPLGAVDGWLEVLQDELADHPDRVIARSLGRAQAGATRMRDIITGLHSYSVARGGELAVSDVFLQTLAEGIAASRSSAAASDGGAVIPQIAVNARQTVRGDRALISQVLDNLIGNSIKYTKLGERPWVHVSATRPVEGWVTIRVDDAGIGVPLGQEEKIFEEFHRVPGHAKSYVGTGLGLSICKRMVQRHGGSIHAEAREGGGTRVEFTLPAGGVGASQTVSDTVAQEVAAAAVTKAVDSTTRARGQAQIAAGSGACTDSVA